jgi:hypothetical protein
LLFLKPILNETLENKVISCSHTMRAAGVRIAYDIEHPTPAASPTPSNFSFAIPPFASFSLPPSPSSEQSPPIPAFAGPRPASSVDTLHLRQKQQDIKSFVSFKR